MHGVAEMTFATAAGRGTCLARLYQRAPARVLFPDPVDAGQPLAVLLNTGGGLVGGDHFEISVEVAAGASALITQQAAEKVYRSPAGASRLAMRVHVGAGGWLEWLPQETILFDDARLKRRNAIDVAAGGRLLAGEMLVFGRRARGEAFRRGLIEERWEVRRDGETVWAEALRLDGDVAALLEAAAALNGAAAVATTLLIVDDSTAAVVVARQTLAAVAVDGVRAAATMVAGVVIIRWWSGDAMTLRAAYGHAWAMLRHHFGRLRPTLPRLWWT
jgi:urease accessory protein